MEAEMVKEVFAEQDRQDETDQRTRLGWAIKAAIQQKREKEETLVVARREIGNLEDEISKLDAMLVGCEDEGDPTALLEYWARRQNDGACDGKSQMGFVGGHTPGRTNPAVQIDVRG